MKKFLSFVCLIVLLGHASKASAQAEILPDSPDVESTANDEQPLDPTPKDDTAEPGDQEDTPLTVPVAGEDSLKEGTQTEEGSPSDFNEPPEEQQSTPPSSSESKDLEAKKGNGRKQGTSQTKAGLKHKPKKAFNLVLGGELGWEWFQPQAKEGQSNAGIPLFSGPTFVLTNEYTIAKRGKKHSLRIAPFLGTSYLWSSSVGSSFSTTSSSTGSKCFHGQ